LLYQAHHTAAPWAVRPAVGDFFADPASALGGTLGFLVAPLLVGGAWWCRSLRSPRDGSLARLLAAIGLLTALVGFLAAQIEPSWTVRYLAVIVGPLLLASAGALGSSRRGQAVVATVCVAVSAWAVIGMLIPNPSGRYAKSNVSAVVRAVSDQLRPGDMVIVTQTEQLAVASHYLPPGLIYANPTGQVYDPSVVDWRNIVARLQASSPCSALGPALNALPLGTAVLEINPVRQLGASGTAWSRAVNYQVGAVDSFLAQDPALVATGLYTPALDPRPFSPVDGVLFRKVSTRPACSY
jgi:hypothetical protein